MKTFLQRLYRILIPLRRGESAPEIKAKPSGKVVGIPPYFTLLFNAPNKEDHRCLK